MIKRYGQRVSRLRVCVLNPRLKSEKDDSPETFLGAPLGLQVVGQKYEDEKVLAALIVVSRIVQAH